MLIHLHDRWEDVVMYMNIVDVGRALCVFRYGIPFLHVAYVKKQMGAAGWFRLACALWLSPLYPTPQRQWSVGCDQVLSNTMAELRHRYALVQLLDTSSVSTVIRTADATVVHCTPSASPRGTIISIQRWCTTIRDMGYVGSYAPSLSLSHVTTPELQPYINEVNRTLACSCAVFELLYTATVLTARNNPSIVEIQWVATVPDHPRPLQFVWTDALHISFMSAITPAYYAGPFLTTCGEYDSSHHTQE